MLIDLGGIAKGYAVGEAIKALQAHGVTDAQIDAGGDLATIASPLTAGKRHIYIRHPEDRQKYFGRFRMDVGTVATSGDYERYFIYNGQRFHHILDPRNGLPARSCRSVTIRAMDAALADGLSTAVFILGPDQGMALVEQLPDVEAVILYDDGHGLQSKVSSGLQAGFELL
jgi:thiamine biosynthesis lipoprotein